MISRLGSMRLSLNPFIGKTSANPSYGYGGHWVFAEGEGRFSIGRPMVISVRDWSRRSVIENLYCYECSLGLLKKTSINICITLWPEPIRSRTPEFFPGFGILKPMFYRPVKAIHNHVTIERINYGNHLSAIVENLDSTDLETIASFIRPALMETIDAELSRNREYRSAYGTAFGGDPTTAELSERWQDPRHELVELHQRFQHAREDFSPARYDDPALQRYIRSENDGLVFLVADDAAIRIELPRSSHEGPELSGGGVWFGERRCPIEAHGLTDRRLFPPICDVNGVDIKSVGLTALVHPFSTLVSARNVQPEFSERQATIAVDHMRNAILKRSADKAALSFREDVVLI